MPATSLRWMLLSIAALTALGMAGCAQCRLPRIDPTGRSLFLPAPNHTTLTAPTREGCRWPQTPRPAFSRAPTPPPCATLGAPPLATPPPTGRVQPPALTSQPTGQERLILTPTRLVAPVGSQVVLMAGLCADDGRYVTGQTIEWMLTQESVGHILEIAGERPPGVHRALHPGSPRKVSSSYAIGRTTSHTQLLAEGRTPQEQVYLKGGQTWLSVTSAREGLSHVTALAPGAREAPTRFDTAEIYWIDAQWSFPAPAVVRGGQPVTLTTTVSRASDQSPLAGWIVRYEFAGGAPAAFNEQGDATAEVLTDADGRATINVLPGGGGPGDTQIRINVLRPGQSPGEAARLPVGQGWTSVTWSAPGLSLRTLGPPSAAVGGVAAFRLEVHNPGDLPTGEVIVTAAAPTGAAYLSSTPSAQVFGDKLQWRLASVPPKTTRYVDVNLRIDRAGDIQFCASARADHGLAAEHCATTRAAAPTVSLALRGPTRADVGETIVYEIEIVNRSNVPLENVVIIDRFEAGLRHPELPSPIERSLGALSPGEARRLEVTFQVMRPGRHCHTVQVLADGGATATAEACVDAVEPPPRPVAPQPSAPPPSTTPPGATRPGPLPTGPTEPAPVIPPERPGIGPGVPPGGQLPREPRYDVQARINAPAQRQVGELFLADVIVTNSGDTALTDVQVVVQLSPALAPRRASENHTARPGELRWNYPRLEPGQPAPLQVELEGVQPAVRAPLRVTVSSAEGVSRTQEAVLQLVARPQPPVEQPAVRPPMVDPMPPLEGPMQTITGDLEVTVTDTADPIKVGQRTTYLIVVKNGRNVPDRNVALTIQLPEGLTYQRLSGPPTGPIRTDGRTIEIPPIAELRPGEQLAPFRVEVQATRPGKFIVRATARSVRSPEAKQAEADTTVFAE